jgi:hypothetical protein
VPLSTLLLGFVLPKTPCGRQVSVWKFFTTYKVGGIRLVEKKVSGTKLGETTLYFSHALAKAR